MARQLFDTGIFSVIDETSAIGIGWSLGWFVATTTTPTDSYSEPIGGVANANPVPADADGRFPPMWLNPGDYKYVLYDADSVPIKTQDDYTVSSAPPDVDPALYDFLAGDDPLDIPHGGTGEATASNAIAALGGLPVDGGTMTADIIRSTKGVYLYNNAAGMTAGTVYLTASGDPDPSSVAGEWWAQY